MSREDEPISLKALSEKDNPDNINKLCKDATLTQKKLKKKKERKRKTVKAN